MVVGENVTVGRDNEARPHGLVLTLAVGHLPAEAVAEELLEELGQLLHPVAKGRSPP